MFGYIVYRIVKWISMTFPKWFTYKIAVVTGDIFYLFRWRLRRILLKNLRHVFPEKEEGTIKSYARLTFRNFGKYLADFFHFDKFDRETMEKEITIVGQENLNECLKKGKGVINVSAHLGNWELGAVIIALLGYKLNAVVLSHGSAKVNNLFVQQRENKGVRVLPLGNAGFRCIKALRRNELIALVGDRNINETGIRVLFFGEEVSLPRGAATLSLHTHAQIIPTFLIRTKDDKFCFIFDTPIPDIEAGDKEEKIKRVTEEVVRVIETYIRKYPGQWFAFYPLWA